MAATDSSIHQMVAVARAEPCIWMRLQFREASRQQWPRAEAAAYTVTNIQSGTAAQVLPKGKLQQSSRVPKAEKVWQCM
jgi:hypothetical protein